MSMDIRQMTPADLTFAADCARSVGWITTTQRAFEALLDYDPKGCFIAEERAHPVGLCISVNYGISGFVGNLIVVEEKRGRGFGRRLLEHAVAYLHRCGARNVLLDGVPAAVSLYERMGFRRICRSLRMWGEVRGRCVAGVRAIRSEDWEAIAALDRRAFGADRSFFLERNWSLHPRLGRVMERDGEIVGFVLGRRGPGVVGVGPWIVETEVDRAGDLLRGLVAQAIDVPLSLGVLETNETAVAAIRSLGMVEGREPSWRMVLGDSGHLGLSEQCFAIGSPAKG